MTQLTRKVLALGLIMLNSPAFSADLLEVYKQAYRSDPTFQQAIAVHEAALEGIPIARAPLIPQVDITSTGTLSRTKASGGAAGFPGTTKTRASTFGLSLTQQLFNLTDFDTLSQSKLTAAAADATYNAAVQDLMMRVSTAYFNVLKSEEDVRYTLAEKNVYQQQLEQTEQQYKVGLKTMTDVDQAKSAYDSSVTTYISAVNTLDNSREDLRVITNIEYDNLNQLKDDFPLIKPNPVDPAAWIAVATKQNWTLQSSRLTAQAAKKNIDIQADGGYPTLNIAADYNSDNTRSWDATPPGTNHTQGPSLALNLNYPIFQGGLVTANERQALKNYEAAEQQAEGSYRSTINQTKQAYLKIMATISQIRADRQAIKFGQSALEGIFAGYKVGTKTMVDILTAQGQLFQSQSQYAEDRFTYITTSLQLKEQTGTLSPHDLEAVNNWLIPQTSPQKYQASLQKTAEIT